ncbi:MAG: FHA domain-containing protein [Myxococcales bacterium]|nr:FHA domain-containing protein [Myxococcales bacterium]
MGFQLVISEGKEAGREFLFDQDSVLIGRTSECDVILYDPGVSRRHARIFVENGEFFVEDVGSSNGTQVNGEVIKRQPLKDGDSISLGPVVFNFKPTELEPATAEELVGEGGAHTRIVSVSELKKSRNKGVALLPKGADRQEVEQLGKRGTTVLPVLKGPRPSTPGGARGSGSKAPIQRRSDPAMARGGGGGGGGGQDGGGLARGSRGGRGGERLSAADRARLKREGPLGAVKLFWAEASKPKRIIAASVVGLLSLGLLGGLISVAIPTDHKPKPKEPTVLSADPVEHSFGLGETVTFDRPDQKTFEFQVVAPVQVMVVLHYQCSDISKEEVAVAMNGVEVGWLPPDTLGANEATHELLVPANVIKRNDTNSVTFDNVKNPPEADPWKIWNVWVEVAVLPEKDEPGLIADAEEKFERGRKKWDQKDIGATNRWEAYKNFREAWLTLEALPPVSRPATYELARQKMNEARTELDLKCNQLLLEARTAYNLKQYEQADFALKHVNEFFPTRAHPCPMRAEMERYEFEL